MRIEVCFSPSAYADYAADFSFEVVIVIDVLRATSTMVTGLACGVEAFVPVSTVEDALRLKEQGWVIAGERHGQSLPGFDLGNSPRAYLDRAWQGQTIVITTTNGTAAIARAVEDQKQVWIAAFNNLQAVADQLLKRKQSALVLCSGWKNKHNLEDSICAGALVQHCLEAGFSTSEDSSLSAVLLYQSALQQRRHLLRKASHLKRLQNADLRDDIRHCLQQNLYHIVPFWHDQRIIL